MDAFHLEGHRSWQTALDALRTPSDWDQISGQANRNTDEPMCVSDKCH